jgi:hypothetical protein
MYLPTNNQEIYMNKFQSSAATIGNLHLVAVAMEDDILDSFCIMSHKDMALALAEYRDALYRAHRAEFTDVDTTPPIDTVLDLYDAYMCGAFNK